MKYIMLTILTLALMLTSLTAQDSHQFLNPQDINPEEPFILDFSPKLIQEYNERSRECYDKGDYDQAIRYYLAYLMAKPEDATALYNLSCCYGLTKRDVLAGKFLLQAYRQGFRDLEHIEQDKDFEQVRKLRGFSTTMDTLEAWSKREQAASWKKRGYYQIETYLPYYVYLPDGYDKNKSYDLLIGLHGFGDTAEGFGGLWKGRELDKQNCIFIIPEAPYRLPKEMQAGTSWGIMDDDKDLNVRSDKQLEAALLKLTKLLKSQYKVNHTWLMGFSQGAFCTYIIGLENPSIYDGIMVFGGWLQTDILSDKVLKKAKKVKVVIGHGTQDKVVEYKKATEAYDKLHKLGYTVELKPFDAGHAIEQSALLKGIDWLRQ